MAATYVRQQTPQPSTLFCENILTNHCRRIASYIVYGVNIYIYIYIYIYVCVCVCVCVCVSVCVCVCTFRTLFM